MFCYIIGFASLVGKTHDSAGTLPGDKRAEDQEKKTNDPTRPESKALIHALCKGENRETE